jgi:hypothetical protein
MTIRNQQKFGANSGLFAAMEYRIACKAVRWSIEDDLRRHHVAVLEKVIKQNRLKMGRQELVYKRKQLTQVRRPDGSLTNGNIETAKATSDFYNKLYSSTAGQFVYNTSGPLQQPITPDEIRQACAKIRGNTSPGIDGIPSKASKYCIPIASEQLADQLNQMFDSNKFPSDLVHAQNILLHKKCDVFDLDNYRPISLLSNVYKILTRVLTKRVLNDVTNKIPVEQAGFKRSFSIVDHIMSVNLLVEKCREWALPLHMVFIDFKKAFDSIEFNAIWSALEHFNVDPETIRMIKQLYSASKSTVKVASTIAEFNIQRGVRQGDSLSPLLFVLTLQMAIDRVNWRNRSYLVNGQRLRHLDYADDIALVSSDINELQSMLDDLIAECQKIGLQINSTKTKWMSTTTGQAIQMNGINIQQVDSFIYLRQLINQPRDHNKEVGRRIGAAWASFGKARQLLTMQRIPMNIKRQYYYQCIVPTLLYGCESWALTKTTELRLARCQWAMERRLLNIRLIDKRPLEWIRQRTKLNDIVTTYQKRKWKHASKLISRRIEGRWDWQLLNWIPPTSRPLGRPRTRWTDDFKKQHGANWQQTLLRNTP